METREDHVNTSVRGLVVSVAIAMMTMTGAWGAATAATSYHGSDYGQDYNSRQYVRSCDREADSNIIHTDYSFTSNRVVAGAITDGNGSNGDCASTNLSRTVTHHKTCERNHIVWNCGNWVAT